MPPPKRRGFLNQLEKRRLRRRGKDPSQKKRNEVPQHVFGIPEDGKFLVTPSLGKIEVKFQDERKGTEEFENEPGTTRENEKTESQTSRE